MASNAKNVSIWWRHHDNGTNLYLACPYVPKMRECALHGLFRAFYGKKKYALYYTSFTIKWIYKYLQIAFDRYLPMMSASYLIILQDCLCTIRQYLQITKYWLPCKQLLHVRLEHDVHEQCTHTFIFISKMLRTVYNTEPIHHRWTPPW